MFQLNGKVALITGGSRGIGRAIAIKFAQNGIHVVVNYVRHRRDAESTAREIENCGVKCFVVKANVAKDEDVKAMFVHIQEEFGALHFMVSNAASGVLKPALELSSRHWNWAMDINARALLSLVREGVALMQQGGRIMAVSSLGAVRAIENYTAYGNLQDPIGTFDYTCRCCRCCTVLMLRSCFHDPGTDHRGRWRLLNPRVSYFKRISSGWQHARCMFFPAPHVFFCLQRLFYL
jgi:NADP-dependent 3-hydroxy acid dehydrogenase YdfG